MPRINVLQSLNKGALTMTDLILNNRVRYILTVLTAICVVVISWGNGSAPVMAFGTIIFFAVVDALFFSPANHDAPNSISLDAQFRLQMVITVFAVLVMTDIISSETNFYFLLVLPVSVLTWLITFWWLKSLTKKTDTA